MPNFGLLLLNFSHPLTTAQLAAVEALAGARVERVIERGAQFDVERPFGPQVVALVDSIELGAVEWQTLPILVNLPSLNYIAAALLAELHGRMGYFPAVLRLRPVQGSVPARFEVAEILSLQALRDTARGRRGRE